MLTTCFLLQLLVVIFFPIEECSSRATTPFTVHQLHALERVGAPAVNRYGDVVYSVRFWNESSGVATTWLETANVYKKTNPRKLTYEYGISDNSPVFSPDGQSVAFLSNRGNGSQVWVVSLVDSTPYQLTSFPLDVDNLRWSPQGSFLVFSLEVYPDCATIQCTADTDAEIAARGPNTGFLYTSLFVRHWDEWETGKQSHLFMLTVDMNKSGLWSVVGKPVDVMNGISGDCPTYPEGGTEQFELDNHMSAWTTGWQLFIVNISDSVVRQPQLITGFTNARTQNPIYSPTADMIAYLAMDRPGFEADKLHINLYDLTTAETILLTEDWDRSISGIAFSTDGTQIFADADDGGSHKLFIVSVTDGSSVALLEDGDNTNGDTLMVILNRDSMMYPVDIWAFTYSNTQLLSLDRVVFHNQEILNSVFMSTPESLMVEGDNSTVQAWLLRPMNWQNGTSPVALLIHGGPQGAWNDAWSYRWNPQLFVSHGYAVIMVNPHGSTGFGQAFTDAVSKDWGGVPFVDIMNATTNILESQPWMDEDRMCALGASYGGYMINWIHGQAGDKFKCLVVHDGMFNTFSGYYSTDELWFNEWEFGGLPWQSPSLYTTWNPMNFVANWATPTMVVHGGRDYRLSLEQGLSVFTTLQRKGIPSQFLYFPEENHWVLNPPNGIMWYDTVLAWLDQWTPAK